MHTQKIDDSSQTIYNSILPRQVKPFILSDRHEDIIEAIHYYRYARLIDITRLFYQPSSSNHVGEILALLSGHHKRYPTLRYLYRFMLPTASIGQSEFIYTLGSGGRRLMKGYGADVAWHFRPSILPSPTTNIYTDSGISYSQLMHDMLLTHVLVAGTDFCRQSAQWRLVAKEIQYTLRRDIAKRSSNDEKKTLLQWGVPDGLLVFQHTQKKQRIPVLIEIDRAREYQHAFKERIRGLVTLLKSGMFHSLYNTSLPRIGWATTGGDLRLNTMRIWTKEVLHELREKPLRRAFYFRRLHSVEHETELLFCGSSWYRIGVKTPSSLLG